MRKRIVLLILINFIILLCACNDTTAIDDNEHHSFKESKILIVVPDYDGMCKGNILLSDFETERFKATIGKIGFNAENLDFLTCKFDLDKCDLSGVMGWIDNNKLVKKIVLFHEYLPIQTLNVNDIERIKSRDTVLGVVGMTYDGCINNAYIEEKRLSVNLDFNIIDDLDASFGRYCAQDIAKKINGKKGYIILNRPKSSRIGPHEYQESFLDEFEKLKDNYYLSEVEVYYDNDFIYSTEEEKIELIKDDKNILAIIDNTGYHADEMWHNILTAAEVSGVCIYTYKEKVNEIIMIEDSNVYMYYKPTYENAIKAAMETTEKIVNGEPYEKIQYIQCERLN